MAFPREKRENEEFDDEKFLTRKIEEKNEELITLKLRILGIYEANLGIIKRNMVDFLGMYNLNYSYLNEHYAKAEYSSKVLNIAILYRQRRFFLQNININ